MPATAPDPRRGLRAALHWDVASLVIRIGWVGFGAQRAPAPELRIGCIAVGLQRGSMAARLHRVVRLLEACEAELRRADGTGKRGGGPRTGRHG